MTDADRLVRDLSAGLAKDSIVTQALARFLEQVIREIHETRIAPAEARALAAEAALAKAVEDARAEGMQIMTLQADLARYEAAAPLSARETAEYLAIERRLNALRALSAPASKDGPDALRPD